MITHIRTRAMKVREENVAIPAPVRPRAGVPRFPYIKTQFTTILTRLARSVMNMAGFRKLMPSANWWKD